MDIIWKGSPNFNKRSNKPTKIVIHWFGSGTLESANTRFQNAATQVSAHFGISKGRVWQWVKEQDVAFHAGVYAVNKETIGIEHDATLSHNLSDEDYALSGELVFRLSQQFNIPLDVEHIIPHKSIKPTQCPGTVDLNRIIAIAKTHLMTKLNVQVIFNNQQYTLGFQQQLIDAADRLKVLSNSKLEVNYLPVKTVTNPYIPAGVYDDGFGNTDCAIMKDWFIDNVWVLAKDADVVVLVGRKGDWQYIANNTVTYGHYYSELPATFPALIQIVAEQNDMSWKWPTLPALVHYLTHEISHPLQQMSGEDKTHQYDYASVNGLSEILPNLDYNKINKQLELKSSYERNAGVFIKKEGDNTLYILEGDILIPIAASEVNLRKDFPGLKIITAKPNDMLKFRTANFTLLKDR